MIFLQSNSSESNVLICQCNNLLVQCPLTQEGNITIQSCSVLCPNMAMCREISQIQELISVFKNILQYPNLPKPGFPQEFIILYSLFNTRQDMRSKDSNIHKDLIRVLAWQRLQSSSTVVNHQLVCEGGAQGGPFRFGRDFNLVR